jgi:N utilization substance protein A
MVVEDSQLSLAIGKKGQNVRLASKLIGWRIDIKSEEEKRAEIESQIDRMQALPTPLENVSGLTAALLQKLNAAGIGTVEQLADLAPEDRENIPGIGAKTVEKISDALSEYYAEQPSYQDDLERLAAEHMFSKDDDEKPASDEEPAPASAESEQTGPEKLPEE